MHLSGGLQPATPSRGYWGPLWCCRRFVRCSPPCYIPYITGAQYSRLRPVYVRTGIFTGTYQDPLSCPFSSHFQWLRTDRTRCVWRSHGHSRGFSWRSYARPQFPYPICEDTYTLRSQPRWPRFFPGYCSFPPHFPFAPSHHQRSPLEVRLFWRRAPVSRWSRLDPLRR